MGPRTIRLFNPSGAPSEPLGCLVGGILGASWDLLGGLVGASSTLLKIFAEARRESKEARRVYQDARRNHQEARII